MFTMKDHHRNFGPDMLLRRRFLKRLLLIAISLGLSFYISVLLFGNIRYPVVMRLTDLSRCPACYGVSVCPHLYSDHVSLESSGQLTNLFNAKNIHYGYTKSNHRKVVLKKLAHDWELKEFDSKLCSTFDLPSDCKPKQLLNVTNMKERISKLVSYNFSYPETEPRKGVIMCPYANSVFDFTENLLPKTQTDLVNIWTMLSVNPEPIILQAIPKSQGWRVPAYGGVCGRVELVAYEGEPLSSLTHVPWMRKLSFAKQIIDAALDFTFKHERYRFYLMDWSLDNIVADSKDVITFVDLEDIVVLDKHSSLKDIPNWFKRYSHENSEQGFTFSIDNLCKHHLSDHNLWAACYILVGEESPLLLPVPKEVESAKPYLVTLLKDCLYQEQRYDTALKLQQVIGDMLSDTTIVNKRER